MWTSNEAPTADSVTASSGPGPTTSGLVEPVKALSAASARLRKRAASAAGRTSTRRSGTTRVLRRSPGAPPSQALQNEVAVLRAQGLSTLTVGRLLRLSDDTIRNIEKLPTVKERITELRQVWKEYAHTAIVAAAQEAWEMVHETAKQRDAKGFDQSTRGLHALEKISSSVSGEAHKVEVSGSVESNPNVDLKILIAGIFGKPHDRQENI